MLHHRQTVWSQCFNIITEMVHPFSEDRHIRQSWEIHRWFWSCWLVFSLFYIYCLFYRRGQQSARLKGLLSFGGSLADGLVVSMTEKQYRRTAYQNIFVLSFVYRVTYRSLTFSQRQMINICGVTKRYSKSIVSDVSKLKYIISFRVGYIYILYKYNHESTSKELLKFI